MNTNLYKSTEASITKNGVEMTPTEAASELQELSRVSYRLECDKINLTETAKQLELERDELRGMLWSGNYNDKQRMAEHDAKVIEEAIRLYGRKTLDGNIIYVEGLRDYAEQLRQKAQDESK
jgi:hypothetical protein